MMLFFANSFSAPYSSDSHWTEETIETQTKDWYVHAWTEHLNEGLNDFSM